jgi:hypothetical protein
MFYYILVLYHMYYVSLPHYKRETFVKDISSNFINFGAKITFELKVLACVVKNNFIDFKCFFSLLIIINNILSNLKKERCTFDLKQEHLKNKLSTYVLNLQNYSRDIISLHQILNIEIVCK